MTTTYYETDVADLICRHRYLRLADSVLESYLDSILSRAERYGKWVLEHDRVACEHLEDIYRLKRDAESVNANMLSDLVTLGWRGIGVAALLALFKPKSEYAQIFEPLMLSEDKPKYHQKILRLALKRCKGTPVNVDEALQPLVHAVERLEGLMRTYPVLDAPRLRLAPTESEIAMMADEKKLVRDAYRGGRLADALKLANSGVLARYR